MSQNYSYPSSSQVTITGIGNPTGVAVPADAVYIGAEDNLGNLHGLQVDSSGFLKVSIAASPLTPIATQDAADGPVSPGAAASKSMLMGVVFNTALPTLTNGQQASIQADSSGRIILAPLTNSSIVKSQLQDNSGNALSSTGNALDINLKTSSITLPVSAASLPLPTGAATEATLSAMSAKLPAALGAQLIAASLSVNIASNQTVPISAASLPLPSGAATDASVTNPQGSISGGTAGSKSNLAGGIFNTALPTITNGQQAALQLDSSARLILAPLTNSSIVKAQLQDNAGTAITLGSKVSASSIPVVIASDQGSIPVANTPATSSTATLSNVSSSATNVTILSSNASRKGATIFNESTSLVYVKFGTTASATSYTVQIAAGGYYELPFTGQGIYTGRIDGIWASANGSARVTELT